MRPFDRAVLMRHAAVVAGGFHAVVLAQRPVAPGHVLDRVLAQVAERRRQAVGAVLAGRAAEMPQRVLQPLRERREALAAQHHPGMGEARPGEAEVIEHVVQRLPRHGHAERVHAGEVGQALPARLVLLAEDHVLLRAVLGAPGADPPLQRTPHPRGQFGMAAHQLLEHADRADERAGLKDRHDVLLEDSGQRVRTAPALPLLLPSGMRIGGKPVAGGTAEARLGGRHLDGVGLLMGHEQPLLAIGYVTPGQRRAPPLGKASPFARPTDTARRPGENFSGRRPGTPIGLRPPCVPGRRLPPSHPD